MYKVYTYWHTVQLRAVCIIKFLNIYIFSSLVSSWSFGEA